MLKIRALRVIDVRALRVIDVRALRVIYTCVMRDRCTCVTRDIYGRGTDLDFGHELRPVADAATLVVTDMSGNRAIWKTTRFGPRTCTIPCQSTMPCNPRIKATFRCLREELRVVGLREPRLTTCSEQV